MYKYSKMAYLVKVVYICILYILILSIPRSYAKNINIQVLTDKPDIIIQKSWKEYSTSIENYFKTKVNNSVLKNINISFSYNSNEPNDKKTKKDYENYVKYIIEQLKSSTYDIFILDGRFLFSDNSFVESSYLKDLFNVEKINHFYENLTKDIDKKELDFNNKRILEGGYLENDLYGLPYELDFDLLYYHKKDVNTENLDLETIDWNDLFSFAIAYGNDDELLNIFTEYVSSHYDFSNNDSSNSSFEIFYNDTSKELFTSVRDFIIKSSYTDNLATFIDFSFEDAYNSFDKGDSLYFKGKASHYYSLVQNGDNGGDVGKTVFGALPPRYFSVLQPKYLVINKNSDVDKKILKEVARELVSKDFQIFKAEKFGSIPTFDIRQRTQDSSIDAYYRANANITKFLEEMKSIDIKEMFESKYGAPYMETRLLLPQAIKSFIRNNNHENITDVFENTRNLVMQRSENKNTSFIVLYIAMFLFSFFSLYIMFLLHKYRNHPNLKVFSSGLCNLVILGYLLNIIATPFFKMQNPTLIKCHIEYVYETVITNLYVLPLLAITFRIYAIYHNKSTLVNSNKLDNKHLYTYILIFMGTMILVVLGISSILLKFYIKSYGSIESYRIATCDYTGGYIYELTERLIYTVLFIIMFVMIIKTGKVSKHYGQFNFIYVLVLTFIIEGVVNGLNHKLPTNRYTRYYIMFLIFIMLCDVICIYVFVGTRLRFIFKHPEIRNDVNIVVNEKSSTNEDSNENRLYIPHPFERLKDESNNI